jgi:hypothetical protein
MNLKRMRPSGAMIVACVALVAAIGGTSYAATMITSADVDNRSLKGKDLVDDTVRGRQIGESSLGKVPSAVNADTADAADTAGNADVAANAANADRLAGETAADQKVRWLLFNEQGQIEDQSGGFRVLDAFQTNSNVYIDAGESLVGKGLTASIAIQNQVDVDGMDGDAEPDFDGEISVIRCQIPGVVECAPPSAKNVNALVVSPRNSDGSPTTSTTRKRFYVQVTE